MGMLFRRTDLVSKLRMESRSPRVKSTNFFVPELLELIRCILGGESAGELVHRLHPDHCLLDCAAEIVRFLLAFCTALVKTQCQNDNAHSFLVAYVL
jgi:hypothetical protein